MIQAGLQKKLKYQYDDVTMQATLKINNTRVDDTDWFTTGK